MPAALPPRNTALFLAIGLGAAWLFTRNQQNRAIAAGYGQPYATPMSRSYLQSPAVGGYSWFGSANAPMTATRGYGVAQPDPYGQAGQAVGKLLNRWLSPNTDAPYNAPVPDQWATGSSPSLSGNWGYSEPQLPSTDPGPNPAPADLMNWYG